MRQEGEVAHLHDRSLAKVVPALQRGGDVALEHARGAEVRGNREA
jgi:hypothetical protein